MPVTKPKQVSDIDWEKLDAVAQKEAYRNNALFQPVIQSLQVELFEMVEHLAIPRTDLLYIVNQVEWELASYVTLIRPTIPLCDYIDKYTGLFISLALRKANRDSIRYTVANDRTAKYDLPYKK